MDRRIEAGAQASHRWGLRQVRAAGRAALAGHDRNVPPLERIEAVVIAAPGRDLPARMYVPTGAATPGPLLIFFHGGGFIVGDIETHDALCHRLVSASGVRVLSVEYRLAPEHPYPAQVEDAHDAAVWVFDNAEALGVDAEAVALGGDSAGGYMAVAASLTLGGRIKAQLLLYPLLQLDDEVWARSVFTDSRIVGRVAVQYIRAQLAAANAGAPSLLGTAAASAPPTFVVTGGVLDPVRPDALDYVRSLEAVGAACVLKQYSGQLHGFLNLTHVSKVARQAIEEIGSVFGEAMRKRA